MVKASDEMTPWPILKAFEQIVLTPSEAPILMTFVFKILTPLKVASPPTEVAGFEVALSPPTTGVVQAASE